jgi:type III restriction enzyme
VQVEDDLSYPMKLTFDPNQSFQLDAIEAVCGLFEGQPRIEADLSFAFGGGFGAVRNRIDLDQSVLVSNLQTVQETNEIPVSDDLVCIEAEIETADGPKTVQFPNFSVEMETGTGKTYVYLRTALELYHRYGLCKFIIVVPSIAVREGVLKDLAITEQHFRELYGNIPYRSYVYDSASLAEVRQFALSDTVELMVMTIDSFNRASNVIHQSTDRLQGETPIHLVQATRPVLILDEPQNMESELRIRALAGLDPVLALRYSATHRNPYNLVYRLTPFEAYRGGLVKRIEVASVIKQDDANQAFVRLERIDAKKNTISARVTIHQLMRTGVVREKMITVKPGDSLAEKSSRSEYDGFEVDEINPGGAFIRFANSIELTEGAARGADKEAIFQAQIRYTIEEHFRKQARLRQHGIKVLSLFFIDRVGNYVNEDGLIRKLFDQAFDELKVSAEGWEGLSAEDVRAAYFAQKRRRGGTVEFLDSVSGETKEDTAAYELIMKGKEQLLSFDEPVSFIFSHSALREGWDNPNVFQICTLNQSASEMKKRQEVGRGVRLSRNQDGDRVHDERINVLTVVANESYDRYVAQLQSEIEADYGMEGLPPKPANARERDAAKLRKHFVLRPEFKTLWDQIKHKTRYALTVDTEGLLAVVVPRVDALSVRPPRVAVTKAQVRVGYEDIFEAMQLSSAKTAVDLVGRYPLPNLVALMSDLMAHTTPPVRLTRSTLLEVFKRTTNQQAAMDNPFEFATEAVRVIKDCLADHLVEGIQYEKINEWYEMSLFDQEVESWKQYLVPADHSVYDQVIVDSEIERDFVHALDLRDDVQLYVKLPSWFKVRTPVGEYNPDWAIVMEDRDAHGDPTGEPLLYLVRETKAANWRTSLRPEERRKIKCGERHFEGALGVSYKVVTTAGELP